MIREKEKESGCDKKTRGRGERNCNAFSPDELKGKREQEREKKREKTKWGGAEVAGQWIRKSVFFKT